MLIRLEEAAVISLSLLNQLYPNIASNTVARGATSSMITFEEIQHCLDSFPTQSMRRIANKHRIVFSAQFLSEITLLRQLELGRDVLVHMAQHLDLRTAEIMPRKQLIGS